MKLIIEDVWPQPSECESESESVHVPDQFGADLLAQRHPLGVGAARQDVFVLQVPLGGTVPELDVEGVPPADLTGQGTCQSHRHKHKHPPPGSLNNVPLASNPVNLDWNSLASHDITKNIQQTVNRFQL